MRQIFLVMIGLSVSIWADFTRDNSTQIVIDNTTGLQWQDDVNITKNWTQAIDYCEILALGGYTDWRLPNDNELFYIADRSKKNPAIDGIFQNVVLAFYYWSSTTVVGNVSSAWGVSFSHGGNSSYGKSNSRNVRCVRAGQ